MLQPVAYFFRKQALSLNRPFLSYANTLLQSKSKKQSYKLIAELHAHARAELHN